MQFYWPNVCLDVHGYCWIKFHANVNKPFNRTWKWGTVNAYAQQIPCDGYTRWEVGDRHTLQLKKNDIFYSWLEGFYYNLSYFRVKNVHVKLE